MSEALKNEIHAYFGKLTTTTTAKVSQWAYGQKLIVHDADLPSVFEAYYSNSRSRGEAKPQIGTDGEAPVPDEYFLSGADIYVFLMEHEGADDGRYRKIVHIPIDPCAQPSDVEPSPVQQNVIDQAIAALNTAVTQTAADVTAADASAQVAAQSATNAQTAAQSAQASATSASGSASTASTAAATATQKASEAATSASEAESARASARNYALSASDSAGDAELAKTAAQIASATATAKASEASTSATSASGSASAASASASAASESATSAANSATAAAGSATTASTKANEASASATAANTAKTAAQTAQTAAQSAQAGAEAAKDETVTEAASIRFLMKDKADIIISTAEGAIATFMDGGNNMPTMSCMVEIEPVQSGSGDPSPDNVRPITGWTGLNLVVSPTEFATDGTTYPVSWESEADTVYGGTLDVVTGELKVDRVMTTINALTWSRNNTRGIFYSVIPEKENAVASSVMCDRLPYKGTADSVVHAVQVIGESGVASSLNTSQPYIYLIHGDLTTQADLKAALGEAQITYQLATPQTYQLTPTEVRTLLGLNNVWADTGDVEVQYRADTKLYIDGKGTDWAKLIAPTEAAYTATRAYTSGSLLIVGSQLYKATTSIANGATLTVGTNITATTLAEVIAAL